MADRPVFVGLISLLTMIWGIFAMVAGAIMQFVGANIWTSVMGDISVDLMGSFGLTLIIVGLVMFIVGLLIWIGWSLAWFIAVIIYAITVIGSIYIVICGGTIVIIPFLICLLILIYLLTPKVRKFFLS